jgi:hypothetical protein
LGIVHNQNKIVNISAVYNLFQDDLYMCALTSVKIKNYLFKEKEVDIGVPMQAVNNRPQTTNHYNRQPSNRLIAITVNRYNRLTVSG